MILLYIKYLGVVLLGTALLICLFWVGCFIMEGWRYRRAVRRNEKALDRRFWR